MDPAGPSFYSTPPRGLMELAQAAYTYATKVSVTPYSKEEVSPAYERLDETDAKELQAIHTNKPTLGIIPPIGNADFYLGMEIDNLGDVQPGCNLKTLADLFVPSWMTDMLDKMDPAGFCSHTRVPLMVMESIQLRDTCWAHVHCVNSKGKPLLMDIDTPDDLFEKDALKKSIVQFELGYLNANNIMK